MSMLFAVRGLARKTTPTPEPEEPDDPIAHWKFDELAGTTADDAENLQNGTYSSAVALGVPAMLVEGSPEGTGIGLKDSANVSVTHNAAFAVPLWTLAGYAMASVLPALNASMVIVSKVPSSGHANEITIEWRNTGGELRLRAYTTTDAGVASWIISSQGVGNFTVGQTYRIALVQRSTGAFLYIDAQEFGPNAVTDGLENNTGPIVFGGYGASVISPLNGCLDDWRFYDRALSAQEIQALPAPQDTLYLADWSQNIDEGTGTIDPATHAHPESGFTTAVVADGAITDLTASGADFDYETTDVSINTEDSATARLTKGSLTSRTATISLTVIADDEATMQPVTIVGNRFYSGGQPYFPTSHFLWGPADDGTGAYVSHVFFSFDISAAKKQQVYNDIKNAGFNSIHIYLLNENDYDSGVTPANKQRVSPFTGNSISFTTFDSAKLASWRTDLETMISEGIRPILWMRADDSPTVNAYSVANFKSYMQRMIDEFDDLPIMWVLGLEVGEYWSNAEVTDYGTYLSTNATQPVGCHFQTGHLDNFDESWCQFAALQLAGSATPVDCYEYVVDARAFAGNKPMLWAEYFNAPGPELQGNTTLHRRMCLAGTFASAAGFGCGGPDGLAEFMEDLPDACDQSSRIGNIITLTGGGVTAEADLDAITFRIVTPQIFGFVDFETDNNGTSNRHYTFTHANVLDPNGSTGWAWGVFLRLGQNEGTQNQYILSSGALDANPSFNWFIGEASHSGIPNEFGANISDATTDNVLAESGASVVLNQTLLLWIQYDPGSPSELQMYTCTIGGTPTLIATLNVTLGNIVAPENWNWGRRQDGQTARYFQEEMGGPIAVSRPATLQEIEDFAGQTDPATLFGSALEGWWPCLNGAEETILDESGNGNHMTRQGTWGDEQPAGQALSVPRVDQWLTNDDTATPGGATVVTTKSGLDSALNNAGSGDTIVWNGSGSITHLSYPNGFTIPAGVTVMAAQGKGIVINAGEAYAGARTPGSGFWTQSGLSADDIAKKIWRSSATFTGGEQGMIGTWVEFNHVHHIVPGGNMSRLRAAYANTVSHGYQGNTNGSYFGPCVHQNSDNRVYIRFQRPLPAKYSAGNKWREDLWPGFPEAVSGGQIVYPMSENPNNYVINIARQNPGSLFGFNLGNGATIGPGVNSCGFRRFNANGAKNITVRRGTHINWQNGIGGASSASDRSENWDVQRARFTCGSLRHLSRAEWKFDGPIEGIRSLFMVMEGMKNIYMLNCTISDFHETGVTGNQTDGGHFRFRNCVIFNNLDEGIQGSNGTPRVEYGYCFLLNANFRGTGANNEEPNDPFPGEWFVHHNVMDCRGQKNINWPAQGGAEVGPCLAMLGHSPNGYQPWKIYNNTILWSPDQEEETTVGIQHQNDINNTANGTAAAHEVFNNIVIRHDTQRYNPEGYSDSFKSRSDFVAGRQHCNPNSSNEFWDFNLYYRDVPGTIMDPLLKEVSNGGRPGSGFNSIAAFKASALFTTSKGSGSERGAYSPGFENSSTDVRPVLPSIDAFSTRRYEYRPSPTAAVTLAKNGTSLSGANWWSPVPTWGATFFSWSAGGGSLQPSNWKGAMDPNGSTITVGVLNP